MPLTSEAPINPVNDLTIFRVQDSEGRGPYKPGFSHKWVEPRDDHQNLPTWYVEFGRCDLRVITGMVMGSATRTIEQLRRWFTPSEYRTLQGLGYQAVKMEAGRIIAHSATQCFFERAKPLREGWEPIELYPAISQGFLTSPAFADHYR